MTSGLGSRIAVGAAWMIALRLLDRSIGVLSVVVLARLLVPADFGLVAMATAIIAVVELLSSFNFDVALIQNQQAPRSLYDTAWTLNVAMAVLCAVLAAAAAYPASAFFGEPRLGPLLLLLSLATLARGFENVGVVAFRKELQLDREFRFLLARRIGVFVVTVSTAIVARSYWALAAGIVVGSVWGVLLSFLLHPFRPRFGLRARGELLHFSKWLVFSNVVETLASRAGDIIMGKSLGAGPLGLYNLAHEVSHLPSTELSAPINRAVYPGYAKVAADQAQLKGRYLEVLGLLALLTMPAAVGIALVAPLLVPLLLGDAWRDAVPLTEILALAGLLTALRTNAGYVFLARGRSELLALLNAVRLALIVPALFVGVVYFGILGAAFGIFGVSVAMLPVTHLLIHRVLGIRWLEHAGVLWRPAVASAGMALLVGGFLAATAHGLAAGGIALSLASAVLVGIVAYLSLASLLWAACGFPRSAEAHVLVTARGMLERVRGRIA